MTEVDDAYVKKAEQWRRSLGGTQKALAKSKARIAELESEIERLRELVDKLLADMEERGL